MPSFSSLFTSLTGAGFYYERNPRHATYNFNQDSQALYRNQPRFPFEYYININLNSVKTDKVDSASFIAQFFNGPNWAQVMPLVKTIDMPSMKIETTALNQYNRKRISQTKIDFEPVKVVFHDVADGKTLRFWEMYYRYYFGDGIEPGKNEPKQSQQKNKTFSVEQLIPKLNPALASLPASVKNLFQSNSKTKANSPVNTVGDKSALENIVSDTLDNHSFGFNLPQVNNVRNLIQSIDIFQVHGGRFNKVTLVNPRVAAFTHDVLNYSDTGKTLELTFTFEYEYAYYTIQNLKLGEPNTGSSLEPFEHGEFLELPSLAFNAQLVDFIESNNPLINSDNPILQRIGKNVQNTIGATTGAFLSDKVVRRATSSALDGMAKISPTPYYPKGAPPVTSRPFGSTAGRGTSMYKDVNRTGGNGGG